MSEAFKDQGRDRSDPLSGIDLTASAVTDNPHPTYGWLQRHEPVAWSRQLHGWIVTGYDDVRRALQDPRLSVEKLAPFASHATQAARPDIETLNTVLADWMVMRDPPHHSRLRRALKDVFMPQAMARQTPRIESVTAELLDAMPPEGECDVVEHFAYPLPAMVISDLFGMPREEVGRLKAWSDDVGKFVLGAADAPDRHAVAAQALREMTDRFRELTRSRRQQPGDDFTTHMAAHPEKLSDDEIAHSLTLVLFAGHETTTNLIASSIYHLARLPDRYAALRKDPGLIPDAVEEFLRFDGPIQMVVRLARSATRIGGRDIAEGERVLLVLNAANRDPTGFDAPEDLDTGRQKNRHVAFGRGIHICLGAPLARLEGRIALRGLSRRYGGISLSDHDAVSWRRNLIVRGPRTLKVRLTR